MKGLGRDQGRWRKSSYSGAIENGCVEAVLTVEGRVGLRDSENVSGPCLDLSLSAWAELLHGVLTPRSREARRDGEIPA
ncbi:hypothetical protein GCM10007079_04910 [Nocardiopsis terrae]|uniref:DUF397 domain-containing protein n=1 Tax=Nocardiopsis terrae TaxID=372655 RepID=A0ABR9HNH5_9ACTN|nr:DUF397 domain-containing protein [Nocardiopsis terrae]MBE1460544.1 hypothetical protein [Nocardiopsis terrae]GHC72006.1 hypothetical protein GCM10007079_04910 [Nocardiopsis terrae]